jgi:hypothetical protein
MESKGGIEGWYWQDDPLFPEEIGGGKVRRIS